jgi:hypothetical protein
MIARLPAALSFRLGFAASDSAHLLRCAAAIRFRAATDIFRRSCFGGSEEAAGEFGAPSNIALSSLICESMCRFCLGSRAGIATVLTAKMTSKETVTQADSGTVSQPMDEHSPAQEEPTAEATGLFIPAKSASTTCAIFSAHKSTTGTFLA